MHCFNIKIFRDIDREKEHLSICKRISVCMRHALNYSDCCKSRLIVDGHLIEALFDCIYTHVIYLTRFYFYSTSLKIQGYTSYNIVQFCTNIRGSS